MLLTASLAFNDGLQDAYTYIIYNHVFMNAQTDDIVLMSTKFLAGDFSGGIHYLLPLFAFVGNIPAAEQLKAGLKQTCRLHWRQSILLLEILLLGIVRFLGEDWNLQADMLVSFARAMQVQSFRKVNNDIYASTMHIGNLRGGAAVVSNHLHSKRREQPERTLYYFDIVLIFDLNVDIGGNLSPILDTKAILFCPVLLIVGVVLMIAEER